MMPEHGDNSAPLSFNDFLKKLKMNSRLDYHDSPSESRLPVETCQADTDVLAGVQSLPAPNLLVKQSPYAILRCEEGMLVGLERYGRGGVILVSMQADFGHKNELTEDTPWAASLLRLLHSYCQEAVNSAGKGGAK